MLTKNDINFIKSLQDKKVRYSHKLFVAEGAKIVNELLLSNCKLYKLYSTSQNVFEKKIDLNKIEIVAEKDLRRISSLKSTRQVLGIFYMPEHNVNIQNKIDLILDNIQDPGNLGTIIRIADWYGLKKIYCNLQTVDCFNAKTVQASMASIARVNVEYVDLKSFFKNYKNPVFAADLKGESVYSVKVIFPTALIIGSEGKGISEDLIAFISKKINIPKIGKAESLNAAVAAGILVDRLLN
ncbi:MAG: RNA methyltransferase [Bacteroidia bacterium]